jgi:dTDP-4-amino-4,6-dideoxygalactose transaminase
MTSYKVPRYDYAAQFEGCENALIPAIQDLFDSGGYVLGPAVARFEEEFASYLGGGVETVGVNSGTDALTLALHGLGVGPGCEVITVANTFHATVLAIKRAGARPVLVDCRPDTCLIDLEQTRAAITDRTRAILPVHLYGQAVHMAAVRDLAEEYGLFVLEDCAQAVGARSGQSRVGTVSDAGCWSFAPSKNLAAAGDGGAITVNDPELAQKLRLLRHFGQSIQNDHQVAGFNSRLDTIQAMILSFKLTKLDGWNAQRAVLVQKYRDALRDLPLTFQEGWHESEHVFHLLHVRSRSHQERDALVACLQDRGIDAVVRYPVPIHLQPAFAELSYSAGQFPVAEALADESLCLPLFHSLSDAQLSYVCDGIREFFCVEQGVA